MEGLEDVAYISTYMTLLEWWDDFRKHGCHLVPAGGKSAIAQPLAIARHLRIPAFVVCDSDRHDCIAEPGDANKDRKERNKPKHEKDNLQILKLCGVSSPDPFPTATLWGDNVVMWNSEIGKVVLADLWRGRVDANIADGPVETWGYRRRFQEERLVHRLLLG